MTALAGFLTDMSPSATLAADLENDYHFWTRYGQEPGGELHEGADLTWFASGVRDPLFNGVVRFHAAEADADAKMESVLALFRTRGLPMQWMVTPLMRPPDLGRRLEAHGLTHLFRAPGMAIEIGTLRTPPTPEGLTIHRVLDRSMLEMWARIALTCFDVPRPFHDEIIEIDARFGLDWNRPGRRYLGFLDGEPVASSMVYCDAGVAGIYFVGTMPRARGRGIGAAMTAAPLKEAQALGYRVGVLEASPMGKPLYRKMGFRQHGGYDLYSTEPE